MFWTENYNYNIEVKGNERADKAAKLVPDLAPDKFKIPYSDLKFQIKISSLKMAKH